MRELRGQSLFLDCFAGIAGDMFLGAMLDLGVPEAEVRDALATLPLAGYELRIGRCQRGGLAGCNVQVQVSPREGTHHHRSWSSIRQMIGSAALSPTVKEHALTIFGHLVRAESRLHGVAPDDVEFHEVGAIDSIVDIVGAAVALDYLRPQRITSRPVPLGHGFTRCAHGNLPVPAPAALQILSEVHADVEDGAASVELCTPTGAAIVASAVQAFGQLPAGALVAVGYGAGDVELPDRPNYLRAVLYAPRPAEATEHEAVVLEANVDDMPPELCSPLMERLFAAGARDVWYTPIVMKKGRPALTIAALCGAADRDAVGGVLLAESTTIGLRFHGVGRRVLARRTIEIQTAYGALHIKLALDGERVLNAAPEFEDCKRAADRFAVPVKEVFAAALAAYRNLVDSGRLG